MNCKLGDVAYITGLPAHMREANGRFVRLVESCLLIGKPAWVFEQPVWFKISSDFVTLVDRRQFRAGDSVNFASMCDENLRPLPKLSGEDDADGVHDDVSNSQQIGCTE